MENRDAFVNDLHGGVTNLHGGVAVLHGCVAVLNGYVAVLHGHVAVLNGYVEVLNGYVAVPNSSVEVPNSGTFRYKPMLLLLGRYAEASSACLRATGSLMASVISGFFTYDKGSIMINKTALISDSAVLCTVSELRLV